MLITVCCSGACGELGGCCQSDAVEERSFSCSSLPTCHPALSLLFASLEAISLAKEGEALLLSTPLPLPPSLWSACLLAYLKPVSGNKTSWEATTQVQMSRCAPCVLPGLFGPCSMGYSAAFVIVLLTAVETMQRHLSPTYLKGMCTCTAWVGKKGTVVDIHSIWCYKSYRNGRQDQ